MTTIGMSALFMQPIDRRSARIYWLHWPKNVGGGEMSFGLRQSVRFLIACFFIVFFLIPPDVMAQEHVVSPSDLQKEAVQASQTRQHNLEALQQFFSIPGAEKALKTAKLDPEQVKSAVATLSEEDLAQLSARATRAQSDFAAGFMSDRDLLLILVAVAVIILIIVAVR